MIPEEETAGYGGRGADGEQLAKAKAEVRALREELERAERRIAWRNELAWDLFRRGEELAAELEATRGVARVGELVAKERDAWRRFAYEVTARALAIVGVEDARERQRRLAELVRFGHVPPLGAR